MRNCSIIWTSWSRERGSALPESPVGPPRGESDGEIRLSGSGFIIIFLRIIIIIRRYVFEFIFIFGQ